MNSRLKSFLWLLALVAVMAGFFHETIFRGYSLVPADLLHQMILPYAADVKCPQVQNHYTMDALVLDYPWAIFWKQTVLAGQFPLWNPYILGGHPHAAESMPAVFSPFRALLLALPVERALSVTWILQLFLAGAWMFGFLRELGRSRPAAFIGACAWALNSNFLMWYWRMPATFCWAPLVLWMMERSARRASWGYTLAAGGALGVAILCGSVQAAAHLVFLVAGYGGVMVWWGGADRRRELVGRWAAMLAVAAMLSAVHWLPTLELMRLDAHGSTGRRGPPFGWRNSLLGIPALITFVFPSLTGSTETFDLLKAAGATRGDFTGYIGLVTATLMLMGAWVRRRETRVRGLLWIMAAVAGLLLFTPLVRYLYHRFFVVAVFAGAVIAAWGADAVLDAVPEDRRIIRRTWLGMLWLGVAMLAAVGVAEVLVAWRHDALAGAAHRFLGDKTQENIAGTFQSWFTARVDLFFDHYRVANPLFWLPAMCVAVAAAAWGAYVRQRIGRGAFASVLVLTTVADLLVLGRPLVPQVDLQRYPLSLAHTVMEPVLADRGLFRVNRWSKYNRSLTLRPNLLMAGGLQDGWGGYSLAPASMEKLFSPEDQELTALVRVQNTKYLFADDAMILPAEDYTLLARSDGIRTYQNKRCLPRAWWVARGEAVSDMQSALRRMKDPLFDPRAVVLLQEPALSVNDGAADAPAEVTVTGYTPLRVTVRVRCEQPGWLVLADTWYPGWRATLDGRQTKLYRADGVLRAAQVPAGEHHVTFVYLPKIVIAGAAFSFAAGCGLVLASIRALWSRSVNKTIAGERITLAKPSRW